MDATEIKFSPDIRLYCHSEAIGNDNIVLDAG